MRKRVQIEEKPTEESLFDISDAEKQLISDMTRAIESSFPSIQHSSHTVFQPQSDTQAPITSDFLNHDQQQRDMLHEKAHKNQAHANKRAIKGYSKCYTIRTFKKEDHISIAVPSHDRGPTDPK